MLGNMMDRPLLISQLIEFAAQYHGRTEIVSRTTEGPIHRYTYADCLGRTKQLANALTKLGVKTGDRIATLAWNNYRHVELYFGVSGIGAVCHTLNPRLFADQLEYIINHAGDRYIFADTTFVPILEGLQGKIDTVEGIVFMTDKANMPETGLPNVMCYDELIGAEAAEYDWPEFDERTASSLCYTSGTTGNPKGALYSHRSTILHTFSICAAENVGLSSSHVFLPVVPMFHANAWGIPYGCAMTGTKMVMPGPKLDGPSIYELIDQEDVTFAAGVPTVWLMLLEEMRKQGRAPGALEVMLVGGSAVPRAMIQAFEDEFGLDVFHAWGMTETSPVGTNGKLLPTMRNKTPDERWDVKAKQGRAIFGVDLKITNDAGEELPHDGKAFGEVHVRGPWIVSGYFENEEASEAVIDDEGWFRTGDVATLDPDGVMQIVDRSKDVIKSGGEWISSIDLENAAIAHPDVAQAAVIGIAHPKWDERPLLIVVPEAGKEPKRDDVIDFLKDKVAKWWLPDDVQVIDEIPLTATGKISKLDLRKLFSDYKLPTA
ncbi:MAG: 3-(methylthio)propionyl-CoA ligase [Alphaproteobacteria bacterium]|nr:3-(methylthio)propionyl-CoA ligase [Alphaproteobacteria bacterium]